MKPAPAPVATAADYLFTACAPPLTLPLANLLPAPSGPPAPVVRRAVVTTTPASPFGLRNVRRAAPPSDAAGSTPEPLLPTPPLTTERTELTGLLAATRALVSSLAPLVGGGVAPTPAPVPVPDRRRRPFKVATPFPLAGYLDAPGHQRTERRRGGGLFAAALVATALLAFGGVGQELRAEEAYLRSTVGAPWGQSTNEAAMNTAFGANGWANLRYETVSSATLFTPAYTFIFMEGSDSNANELEAYLSANAAAVQTWVAAGGSLFVNAAPNEGDGMSLLFGTTLNYDGVALSTHSNPATAVNAAHPIFNGPFGATGTSFTGTHYSHATVTGAGLSPLLTGTAGTILAEASFGAGHLLFGGMTTTNFHGPPAAATALRANILAYGAGENFVAPVPEPSTWAMALGGLGLLVLLQRRQKRPATPRRGLVAATLAVGGMVPLLLVAIPGRVAAATSYFTTEGSFLAGAPNLAGFQSFETVTPGSYPAGLSVGGLSISTTSGGLEVRSGYGGQLYADGSIVLSTFGPDTVTFNFAQPTSTFGLFIGDFGTTGAGTLTFANSAGDTQLVASNPPGGTFNNARFFGMSNDTVAFTQVTLTATTSGDFIAFDKVYSSVGGAVVPEPSTYALAVLGLTGLAGVALRRRVRSA